MVVSRRIAWVRPPVQSEPEGVHGLQAKPQLSETFLAGGTETKWIPI